MITQSIRKLPNKDQRTYLDYNAMALVRPEILEILPEIFSIYGNPSGVHHFGQNTKRILELNRCFVAKYVQAYPHEVYFTSGATESNNLAIHGMQNDVQNYIFGSTEHDSVTNLVPYDEIIVKSGEINLEKLENLLSSAKGKSFVSVMMVNNETGIITRNLSEAIELTHKYNGYFHSDAAQALGKIDINFHKLDLDFLSVSSLKSGGVIGTGALIKNERVKSCKPIMKGNMRENGMRPGTEALPLITAFIKSLEIGMNKKDLEQSMILTMRNKLENEIITHGGRVIGQNIDRVLNTSYIIMPGIDQSEQVMLFDMRGIAISAGSACYRNRVFSKGFIESIDATEEEYRSGIRVSMGFGTSIDEIEEFIIAWKEIYNSSRSN